MKIYKFLLCILINAVVFIAGYYARDFGLPFNYTSQSLVRMNPVVQGRPSEKLCKYDLRIQYGPVLILSSHDFSEYEISFIPKTHHNHDGWFIAKTVNDNKSTLSFLVSNYPDLGFYVKRDTATTNVTTIGCNYGDTFYVDFDGDGKWNRMTGRNANKQIYSYFSKDGLNWRPEAWPQGNSKTDENVPQ